MTIVTGRAAEPRGDSDSAAARVRLLQEAIKVWKGQLVDFGARNTLLFYRDLKQGTLDLSPDSGADQGSVQQLLAGRSVRLSQLFSDPDDLARAAKRARTIRARSKEHEEEKGLKTLYCAWGMATWTHTKGEATPAAPILLRTLSLSARGSSADDFDLQLTDELSVNPTLVQYMTSEHRVAMTIEELEALVDAGVPGVPDPEPIFAALAKRAGRVPGFAITARVVVGTFSYAKLPMVTDLETNLEALAAHDLIAALAGDRQARQALRERQVGVDPSGPDRIPPTDEFLVLDADSSQNHAINKVLAGQDLVIKGPPGTGKSQTIANLVATLVARGKTVLFVAEKRAAIDAVLRRLADVGLRDLVLDLHDGAGSRRQMAAELRLALERAATQAQPQLADLHAGLVRRRGDLSAHNVAIHESRAPWGISVYELQSRLLGLPAGATTSLRLDHEELHALDGDGMVEAREQLRSYVLQGGLDLGRSDSPWAAAMLISGDEAQCALNGARRAGTHLLPRAVEALLALTRECGLEPTGSSLRSWSALLEIVEQAQRNSQNFAPEVYALPLDDLVADLEEGRSWFSRLFSSRYRRARKALSTHWLADPPQPEELRTAASEAAEIKRAWSSSAIDGGLPRPSAAFEQAVATCGELWAELEALSAALPEAHFIEQTVDSLQEQLGRLAGDAATVARIPELRRLESALARRGLGRLLAELRRGSLPPDTSVARLEHLWLSSVLETVALADPAVGAFNGRRHDAIAEDYRRLDSQHRETTAQRVLRACAEHLVHTREANPDQDQLVRAEALKKTRHLGMRHLFQAAPDVLGALKPCWAMSPLVVSQLLPGDRPYFDVVIFDEASQIPPQEAVPSLLRGRQVVVAGDDRQLPPTAFFVPTTEQEEANPDELSATLTAGFESILDTLTPLIGFQMLQWHYRSRDERLIAFSNHHLYDRALTTFPGVNGTECLRHVLVPWRRMAVGQEQSSVDEVDRVIDLILEHARTRPQESLGVIAMGIKHAERISETLRLARRDRPELDDFFGEGRQEPFFVKNLERVQGDERDAVILSVGYGKNDRGDLPHRFGPLLMEGGERRLNVAVTRAKSRMTVVSSFSADEVDPKRTKAKGADLLRLYLAYAQSGGTDLGRGVTERPPLNPFEISVRDALERAGMPLHAQFGSSGYFIDFAAAHPTKPGRMVLAIECDGARYHSSPTARDRDRLRQEKLEDLGWRFHRIWSTDWFQRQEEEVSRAMAAYREAVAASEWAEGVGVSSVPAQLDDRWDAEEGEGTPQDTIARRVPRPPVPNGLGIADYSFRQLRAMAEWIESDTLPRTADETLAILMSELGFQRRGKLIVERLSQAIAAARGGRAVAS